MEKLNLELPLKKEGETFYCELLVKPENLETVKRLQFDSVFQVYELSKTGLYEVNLDDRKTFLSITPERYRETQSFNQGRGNN